MTLSASLRAQVRNRAKGACEFCGVSEISAGGQLTIDHFQPQSKDGQDSLDNLIYCCVRCNQYKQNYWPANTGELHLWNPRQDRQSEHFLELDTGRLLALTPTGEFTITRLRLNRPALVTYRLQNQRQLEEGRVLTRYRDLTQSLTDLNTQLVNLVEEQQSLLKEQRQLLQWLLKQKK